MMKSVHPRTWISIAVALLIAMFGIGCGGSGGGIGTGGEGTLKLFLADAPASGITNVTINVDRVDANIDGQWVLLTDQDQTINLLDLVFNEMLLGEKVVPAGRYGQVRILVTSATITDAKGTHPIVIPSGSQTGIKINFDFDINPKEITEVLLDFNVHRSIHQLGNGTWHLQPVIPAVIRVVSGTISGTVTDGTNPFDGAVVKATYTSGPNYPAGTVVNETMTMVDGRFKVWALKAGTYTLEFNWTDPANASNVWTGSMTGVEVIAQKDTDVGTITLVGP